MFVPTINSLAHLSLAASKAGDAEARGDKAAYTFWMKVKRDVDQAPLLTPDQRDRLRVLLRRPRTPAMPSGRTRRTKPPTAQSTPAE